MPETLQQPEIKAKSLFVIIFESGIKQSQWTKKFISHLMFVDF